MRILVAGASGLIGSRVTKLLVSQGHEVLGTTRRVERLKALEAIGASGVIMDALDRESVHHVIRTSAPDAVIHELTDLSGHDFAGNARLRVEGTTNLVEAAIASGIVRMIAQSISWAYQPGETPAVETEPLAVDPGTAMALFPSIKTLETAVLRLSEGVVLRYGIFYGPGTWYAPEGPEAARAHEGVIMATTANTSFVHVDDAAAATVAALGWPAGVVNIVDDDPTNVTEWGPLYVQAMGGTPTSIQARTQGRSADNSRAGALGWVPAHSSWRTSLLQLS